MNDQSSHQIHADRLAPAMFALSVVFVILLGVLIVLWVDIPRVAELTVLAEVDSDPGLSANAEDDVDTIAQLVSQQSLVKQSDRYGKIVQLSLFVIWPLFWLEYCVSLMRIAGRKTLKGGGLIRALACLIPPLRLAAPSPAFDGRVWLPRIGWVEPGKVLVNRLERAFGKPMLSIAMLILPILLIEYGLHTLVQEREWLRILLHVCTGFIWCAFTIEFLIMVSATDKRLAYIKAHWIDLAIILLPLLSFLRSFRVLRLAKLAKVQKIAKTGRVFRVRGLFTKAFRAFMLLGFVNRLLRITPEKQLAKLKREYADQLDDLQELKDQIDELESELST